MTSDRSRSLARMLEEGSPEEVAKHILDKWSPPIQSPGARKTERFLKRKLSADEASEILAGRLPDGIDARGYNAVGPLHVARMRPEWQGPRVYFVEADCKPVLVKIGFTDFFPKRLAQLSTMSPVRLRVLATFRCADNRLERALHHRLHQARAHGEWFRKTPELVGIVGRADALTGPRLYAECRRLQGSGFQRVSP